MSNRFDFLEILDITGSTVALHHPYKRFITIFPQLYFIILRQIRPEELLPLSARQSRFTSAGKGDKFVSRVNPFVNPFAHPFCSVNPFLAPIKWVNMGLVQPNFAKPSKIIQIAIIQENARNFSFLAFSIRFCCKISISQRLLNCGARRAAFRPYFLRSFIRGSRVRKPAFFRMARYSGFTSSRARLMPWRRAPA